MANHRLVPQLVGDSDQTGYYFAEWQTRDGDTWKAFWTLPEPPVVRPRFHSDRELYKDELVFRAGSSVV
jgi:hypothetical protein